MKKTGSALSPKLEQDLQAQAVKLSKSPDVQKSTYAGNGRYELVIAGERKAGQTATTIGDISQRMLSQTLRRLEQDGLVLRTAHATVPPRVDYELTALGQSFLLPMRNLLHWAEQNHQQVRDARVAYVPPPRHEAL